MLGAIRVAASELFGSPQTQQDSGSIQKGPTAPSQYDNLLDFYQKGYSHVNPEVPLRVRQEELNVAVGEQGLRTGQQQLETGKITQGIEQTKLDALREIDDIGKQLITAPESEKQGLYERLQLAEEKAFGRPRSESLKPNKVYDPSSPTGWRTDWLDFRGQLVRSDMAAPPPAGGFTRTSTQYKRVDHADGTYDLVPVQVTSTPSFTGGARTSGPPSLSGAVKPKTVSPKVGASGLHGVGAPGLHGVGKGASKDKMASAYQKRLAKMRADIAEWMRVHLPIGATASSMTDSQKALYLDAKKKLFLDEYQDFKRHFPDENLPDTDDPDQALESMEEMYELHAAGKAKASASPGSAPPNISGTGDAAVDAFIGKYAPRQ